jgi:hypothetical protein
MSSKGADGHRSRFGVKPSLHSFEPQPQAGSEPRYLSPEGNGRRETTVQENGWALDQLQSHTELVAALLTRLLENGIRPTMIGVADFSDTFKSVGYPLDYDFDGLLEDIVNWLRDEAIIRFKDIIQGTEGELLIHDCVITAYGIKLLQSKSDLLDGKTPAEVLVENKRGDAAASGFVKAGSLLGGILGGFTKSISG